MSVAKTKASKKSAIMECRRCGVCCTKHQAFVNSEDTDRIIKFLGITLDDWNRLYDDPHWWFIQYRLIRHINGACAFLKINKGLATCQIHAVKPACCAKWQASMDRAECREGIGERI